MKTTKQIGWASLACVLGLTLSCMKEAEINEKYRPSGTEIVFGASTGYQNGDGVRTEYSGATSSVTGYTNSFERIDWVSGDDMTIYYRRGSETQTGVYGVVGTATASGELSETDVTHASGDKLTWASGSGDHEFFAMYPANTAHNSLTGTLVQGTIPGTQAVTLRNGKYLPDMDYGYMVGYTKVTTSSPTSRVTLPFTPAMTAFEFKLKMAEGTAQVTEFKLESTAGAVSGTFKFNATGGTSAKGADWWDRAVGTLAAGKTELSPTSTSVTVTFPSGGATMSSTQELDFTFFALPVDLSQLTVTLTYSIGGGTPVSKKLDLKSSGSWKTFDACKKYIITNSDVPGEDWEYFLDPIEDITMYGHGADSRNFTVTSYKKKGSTTTNLSWTVQYSATGADGTWGTTLPSGASVTTGTTPAAGFGSANSTTTTTTIDQTGHTAALQAKSIISSQANPYDLSMHTIYGATRNSAVTANSYIVNAPGWYMFPLVYGNAIVNGVANTQSYAPTRPSGVPAATFLTPLRNVNEAGITTPYILNDLNITHNNLNGCVVWQDVPTGAEIVLDSSIEVISAPSNAGLSCKYIRFNIEYDRIKQGNILIALRDGNDSNKILWSWHIWVTDENLTTKTITTAYNMQRQMMPVNMGWCDVSTVTVNKYTDRVFYVKIIQMESGNPTGLSTTFKVTQIGDSNSVTNRSGSGTGYTYGRKDPFLPGVGTLYGDDNKNYTTAQSYQIVDTSQPNNRLNHTNTSFTATTMKLAHSIKNPHIFYANNRCANHLEGSKDVAAISNLWNAQCVTNNAGITGEGVLVDDKEQDISLQLTSATKTVYDPCPPGFRVPLASDFSGFLTNPVPIATVGTLHGYEEAGTGNMVYYCNGNNSSGGLIVFPADIYRDLNSEVWCGELDSGVFYGGFYYMTSSFYKTTDDSSSIGMRQMLISLHAWPQAAWYAARVVTYPYTTPVRPVAE